MTRTLAAVTVGALITVTGPSTALAAEKPTHSAAAASTEQLAQPPGGGDPIGGLLNQVLDLVCGLLGYTVPGLITPSLDTALPTLAAPGLAEPGTAPVAAPAAFVVQPVDTPKPAATEQLALLGGGGGGDLLGGLLDGVLKLVQGLLGGALPAMITLPTDTALPAGTAPVAAPAAMTTGALITVTGTSTTGEAAVASTGQLAQAPGGGDLLGGLLNQVLDLVCGLLGDTVPGMITLPPDTALQALPAAGVGTPGTAPVAAPAAFVVQPVDTSKQLAQPPGGGDPIGGLLNQVLDLVCGLLGYTVPGLITPLDAAAPVAIPVA